MLDLIENNDKKQKLYAALKCRASKVPHLFVLSRQYVKKNDTQTKIFINVVFHPPCIGND